VPGNILHTKLSCGSSVVELYTFIDLSVDI